MVKMNLKNIYLGDNDLSFNQQKPMTLLNVYVPNTNASGYIHSKLSDLQRKSDKCIIIENVSTSYQLRHQANKMSTKI